MSLATSATYRTADLFEAAYLLSHKDIKFIGLEPRNERSCYFCFAPEKTCARLALTFVSGNAVVGARDYADAIKRCKDLVFSRERDGDRYAATHR